MTGDRVDVRYLKHPATPHWHHPTVRLGADHHGTWLGCPEGAVLRRGTEAPVLNPAAFVQLIVPDAWWSLLYNGPGARYEAYVDIVTPAVWRDSVVEMVDLDLDVVRTGSGEVEVLDDDEFAEHQATLDYPPELVDGARRSTMDVYRALLAGDEPFHDVAAGWHRRYLETATDPA